MEIDAPHIKVFISRSDTEEAEVRSLIITVAPIIWKDANPNDYHEIKIKRFYLSTSNRVYKCTLHNKSAMARVYGDGASLLVDREHEVEVTRLMCQFKLSAQIYCSFNNGYVVEYIEGNPILVEEMSDPHISPLIASKIADWHCALPPVTPPSPLSPSLSPLHPAHTPVPTHTVPKIEGKRGMWVTINRWLAVAEDTVPFNQLEIGKSEMLELQSKLIPKYSNQSLVMCHNDVNYGNILLNDKEGLKDSEKIAFVDYEYSAFNFRGFDIGNHFNEYCGCVALDFTKYPTRDIRINFARNYVKRCQELNHLVGKDVEREAERVVEESEDFSQVSHLFWHIWALVIANTPNKPGDFDYVHYGAMRLKEYFIKKVLLEERDKKVLLEERDKKVNHLTV